MYNGIGLDTVRGTGTNGYVQRNLSHVRIHKEKVDYKPDEDIEKLEAYINKKGNAELLKHNRKRNVELKCAEMEDLMTEQGYSQEEIDRKVNKFRKQQLEKSEREEEENNKITLDKHGRPTGTETHQIAEATDYKNRKLREAFGLGEFDPQVQAKQLEEEERLKIEKAREMKARRYKWVDEDDVEDENDRRNYNASFKPRNRSRDNSPPKRKNDSRDDNSEISDKETEAKKHKKIKESKRKSRRTDKDAYSSDERNKIKRSKNIIDVKKSYREERKKKKYNDDKENGRKESRREYSDEEIKLKINVDQKSSNREDPELKNRDRRQNKSLSRSKSPARRRSVSRSPLKNRDRRQNKSLSRSKSPVRRRSVSKKRNEYYLNNKRRISRSRDDRQANPKDIESPGRKSQLDSLYNREKSRSQSINGSSIRQGVRNLSQENILMINDKKSYQHSYNKSSKNRGDYLNRHDSPVRHRKPEDSDFDKDIPVKKQIGTVKTKKSFEKSYKSRSRSTSTSSTSSDSSSSSSTSSSSDSSSSSSSSGSSSDSSSSSSSDSEPSPPKSKKSKSS